MEWESGIPRTVAVNCKPAGGGGGMCAFDDFAKQIMEGDWTQRYRPSAADHTTEPDSSVLKAFNRALYRSTRYDLSELCSAFTDDKVEYAMPLVVETMLHAANDAINMLDVSRDSMQQAFDMSQAVKDVRYSAMYNFQVAAFIKKLPLLKGYLQGSPLAFTWDETFSSIDEGVTSGEIDADTAEKYKEQVREFGQTFGTESSDDNATVKSHMAVVRAWGKTILELGDGLDDFDNLAVRASLSVCSSEFTSSDSDSAKRKRKLSSLQKVSIKRRLVKRKRVALKLRKGI
ncbi:hypothetical protein NHQ30_005351 [Ciborinia camelliae]|nr:hypothetical protein NHQ30_005351 [Ciborinia camelliae]